MGYLNSTEEKILGEVVRPELKPYLKKWQGRIIKTKFVEEMIAGS